MSPKFVDGIFGIWVVALLVEVVLYISKALLPGKEAEGETNVGKYTDKKIAGLLWLVFYRGLPLLMIKDLLSILRDDGWLL